MVTDRPLFRIAREVLERNVVSRRDRAYLSAGRCHFRGLWTRDFCFAARGLLALERFDVVRDHLTLLLELRRPSDGLIPRLVDSLSPAWLRVVHGVAVRWVPFATGELRMGDRLRPEYRSEHGVEAIDSNLLTLQTALAYRDVSGDRDWWERHEDALVEVFRYYDAQVAGDLISQGPFADWQDGVRREGRTLYTNLLYWQVARRLRELPRFRVAPDLYERIRAELFRTFFDPAAGLFRSLEESPHVSVDGNLLALDWGLDGNGDGRISHTLYDALRSHALWGVSRAVPPGPGDRAGVPAGVEVLVLPGGGAGGISRPAALVLAERAGCEGVLRTG